MLSNVCNTILCSLSGQRPHHSGGTDVKQGNTPVVAIMAVTEKRKYKVLGGGGHLRAGRSLWGGVTKPRLIDSGGHELHMGNPSGLIPCLSSPYWLWHSSSLLFSRNLLYLLPGHQSLLIFTLPHWPLLLSLPYLTMTSWGPKLVPWTTSLSTQICRI